MIFETNYKRLLKLIPDLEEISAIDYRISTSGGYMDLHLDIIEVNSDEVKFALVQYYDNGDVDADMLIRINRKTKTAEVLSFKGALGTFTVVYKEDKQGQILVNQRAKNELNRYLRTWLKILKKQNHTNFLSHQQNAMS